jgi:hypothetical protein
VRYLKIDFSTASVKSLLIFTDPYWQVLQIALADFSKPITIVQTLAETRFIRICQNLPHQGLTENH